VNCAVSVGMVNFCPGLMVNWGRDYMKPESKFVFKKLTQVVGFVSFISGSSSAFGAQELVLAAPQETLSHLPQHLLKLPVPHTDTSVYDEEPVHYHYLKAAGVGTLVISPAKPALPTPSATPKVASASASASVSAQSNAINYPAKKAKPKPPNIVDDQDDKADDSHFSLQKASGLGEDSRVQINGFISAGSLITTEPDNYVIPNYGLVHNDLNYAAASRIGLQVTGNIIHNLAVVGQFVANGDNTAGRTPYNVTADWAYIRYYPRPDIQIRTGRFRLPTLFYSENAEVGYTYPWIVLPNEVYGIVPITNLNGASAIATYALGQSNWTVKAQPFYGSSFNRAAIYNTYNINIIPGTVFSLEQNNVYGGSASVGNPYFEVRGSYMSYETTVTAPLLGGALCPNGIRSTECRLFNDVSSDFFSLGAKLDIDHFLLIGEYAHRNISAFFANLSSFYVMAAYQFRGFMPNISYSYAGSSNSRSLFLLNGEFPVAQDTWTLGLNYTVNTNLLAKMSLSAIQPLDGSYGFFNSNPGRKTIMMYGISLDAIF
jgi:hypothetical protein